MLFRQIIDPGLAQYAYLVGCQATRDAIVIDPERDIDRYVAMAAEEGLRVKAVAETHIHADFLSGAREFAERHGVEVYLSAEGGSDWQYRWIHDERYRGHLVKDGDTFRVGNVELQIHHMPGHTPEHICFSITDRGSGADRPMGIVSGDFVFVGDVGRPDLLESAAGQVGAMESAARALYGSLQAFLGQPDYLQLWPGHGAGSACGKALGAVPSSSVGYERMFNTAIQTAQLGEQAFVAGILEGQPEPPLYFGRMKRLNKEGPLLLGELPRPRVLEAEELPALAGRPDVVVIDTRADREAFLAGHLPLALHAPLDSKFATVVGSYVEPGVPIYLIAPEPLVREAVRALVRIGLDEIAAYASPETLARHESAGGATARIERIEFATVERLRQDSNALPLDVRSASEYRDGHVPGALNIAHTRLVERKTELPSDRPLLVYCRTGSRAAAASALLARDGYDVRCVDDRFDACKTLEVARGRAAGAPGGAR